MRVTKTQVTNYEINVTDIAEYVRDYLNQMIDDACWDEGLDPDNLEENEKNLIKVKVIKEVLKDYGLVINDEGDAIMDAMLRKYGWKI